MFAAARALSAETCELCGGKGDPLAWVWSDLHLRHGNIIRYCKRPFVDAGQMGKAMMASWKSVVADDDTVLNGGDIALAGSLDRVGRAEIREAPGCKLLVVGNHDRLLGRAQKESREVARLRCAGGYVPHPAGGGSPDEPPREVNRSLVIRPCAPATRR